MYYGVGRGVYYFNGPLGGRLLKDLRQFGFGCGSTKTRMWSLPFHAPSNVGCQTVSGATLFGNLHSQYDDQKPPCIPFCCLPLLESMSYHSFPSYRVVSIEGEACSWPKRRPAQLPNAQLR